MSGLSPRCGCDHPFWVVPKTRCPVPTTPMRLIFLLATLFAAALGCSSAFRDPATFRLQIESACRTEEGCAEIASEARARKVGCKDNTIGYVRCSDAQAHLVIIDGYRQRYVDRRNQQAARQAEAEARQREADQNEALEEAERKAAELEAARAEAEWSALNLPLCSDVGDESECNSIKRYLLRYPDSNHAGEAASVLDAGQARLAARRLAREEAAAKGAADEAARLRVRSQQQHQTPASGGSDGIRCCDGTISGCATVHRGCCSHHGGVCQ